MAAADDNPFALPLARIADGDGGADGAQVPCPVCRQAAIERGHLSSAMSMYWHAGASPPRSFRFAKRPKRVSPAGLFSTGFVPALRCAACRTIFFTAPG